MKKTLGEVLAKAHRVDVLSHEPWTCPIPESELFGLELREPLPMEVFSCSPKAMVAIHPTSFVFYEPCGTDEFGLGLPSNSTEVHVSDDTTSWWEFVLHIDGHLVQVQSCVRPGPLS